MLAIFASLLFCVTTVFALREGIVGRGVGGRVMSGFDTQSIGMGLFAVAGAIMLFGPLNGLAVIASVALHEFGHVAAFRIAGHSDARFRILPFLGGDTISDKEPASQEKAFFIALMGSGICIAPMVLALSLAGPLADILPGVSHALWAFGVITGALNFFNLLPLWPLDGGHCLRHVVCALSKPAGRQISSAMAGAAVVVAINQQSMGLLVVAIFSVRSLLQDEAEDCPAAPMEPGRALLALAAYVATGAVHLVAGWPLLSVWF